MPGVEALAERLRAAASAEGERLRSIGWATRRGVPGEDAARFVTWAVGDTEGRTWGELLTAWTGGPARA